MPMNDIILLVISTLALLAGLAVTAWIHSSYALDIVVRPAPPPPTAPLVSIIVPARNEARNIRRCVEALLAQTYPNYELIVVDDRSTDATPAILTELLRRAGGEAAVQPGAAGFSDRVGRSDDAVSHLEPAGSLRVLHSAELPTGWAGKPHALAQGAAAAGGEWLCFIDADTFARPALIASALAAAQAQRADLFSLLTDQELGSFWEKVILPVVFTALSFGFPARRVNDPNSPDAIANGQFILVRRSVYAATGGHAAVRGRIDEDKALAERVKRAGFRLVLADGRTLARTRMYTSFPEIWEGWTKNIFLGMRGRLSLLLFGALVGLLGALALPLWLAGGIAWFAARGGWLPAVIAAQAGLLWAYLLWLRARVAVAMGIPPLYALSLPLGALVFTAMLSASAFRVLSGRGVTWKGRLYK